MCVCTFIVGIFLFKQKTAYEMRISDWSSDVCSSDLLARLIRSEGVTAAAGVPTVWLGLVEHLEAEGGEVLTLERILVGGSAIPPAQIGRASCRERVCQDV